MPTRILRKTTGFLLALCFPLVVAWGKEDLTALSLEQLLETSVTSVSKTAEKRFEAPAAIYVISQEDIRRSGVTSIPEALRLAPGVDVARINSNQWSVGVRGFGTRLARSTLVLIDGRSVYTPLFAGTYWELQDTMMEDIDRIEVIRGPGGTLWGSNAVNGVINIITKNANETQGTLSTAGGGTEEKAFAGFRCGGKNNNFNYRFYGKYFDRDASYTLQGDDYDDWHMGQTGFRTDTHLDENNSLTVQGDAYRGKIGQRVTHVTYTAPFAETIDDDGDMFGTNVLGRWERNHGPQSNMALQMYYDRTDRDDPDLEESRDTIDVDFQHLFAAGNHNAVSYGAGYRVTSDHTDGIPTVKSFAPPHKTLNLWSAFLQDQIVLVPERLDFTLGSKFEHNDYTGHEVQPNGRLAWTPTNAQTVWGSVSRAVRTPSRVDRNPDIAFASLPPPPVQTVARFVPTEEFRSETILSYEMGYRVRTDDSFFTSVDGFYNEYDHLQSLNIITPFLESNPPPLKVILPFVFANGFRARVYGGELNSVWNPLARWRLEGSYSYVRMNLYKRTGTTDGVTETIVEGSTPRHQATFRSLWDLPGSVEIDPTFRYVGGLPAQQVPAYWTMDLHVGWKTGRQWEWAVVGQNLLQARHAEYGSTNEIQRGVYAKATWRWDTP